MTREESIGIRIHANAFKQLSLEVGKKYKFGFDSKVASRNWFAMVGVWTGRQFSKINLKKTTEDD